MNNPYAPVKLEDGSILFVHKSGDKSFWVKKDEDSEPFLVLILPSRPRMSGGKIEGKWVCLCMGSRELSNPKSTCCHIEAAKNYCGPIK